jgi:CheY-like chemotaxis protein
MRRRILYIEDNAESMALVQTFLEKYLPDVLVDVCTTEAGAEAHLNTTCYDLIICDFRLPGAATGAMIAEKVLARDPGQPFYLMSEYIGGNVKAEADRVGLELHGKFSTVPADEFLSRVKTLLQRRPCAEASTAIAESVDADRHDKDGDASSSVTGPSKNVTSRRIAGDTSVDGAGGIDDSTETRRASAEPSRLGVAARQERRGYRVLSRPIRLSSPHVLAARASLGRV